jgi:hypothetical protein
MASRKRKKKTGFTTKSLLAGLFLLVLVSINLAIFFILYQMITGNGLLAQNLFVPQNPPPAAFTLPQPTDAPPATAPPTQVAGASTPTTTPTSAPPPAPSPTAGPPPATSAPSLPTATAAASPVPATGEIRHVVIISVDGLRPDALALANTPNLDALIAAGAYSPEAQTVSLSITLPSHASMLGGMTPDKHGIEWGLPYIGWPGMNGPTLFSVAHDAGLSTGMVFGKEKLNYLVLPNSVDKLFGVDAHDPEIKEQALEFIEAGMPNAFFIHFPDTDRVGHAYGWMSENQLYAVTFVDGLIGEIVSALKAGGYWDSTLLIVTADHGGHGKGHGDDSPLDRIIPWLAVGPGVAPGTRPTGPINTYDTAATALHALQLPIPQIWDGQPVTDIFTKPESQPFASAD